MLWALGQIVTLPEDLERLSSRTPKRALIWKWGLCRWSQVKRRSFPSNPTIPSSRDTGLLMRRERYRDRFAWREDAARCRENAEMPDEEKGAMLLSAKGRQALPARLEARGGAGPRLSPVEN